MADNNLPIFERDRLAQRAELNAMLSGKTEQERSAMPYCHEMWSQTAHYSVGDVVRRWDRLYKCLIEHDAQAAWKPEDAPSLWARIMYRDGIRIIPDVITATEAFANGERGWWGDVLYASLITGNTFTPEQYPSGWELASDALPQEEPGLDPQEPEPYAIPEWEQPYGIEGYIYGEAVMHNGVKWINTLYGMLNTYEPGVYGWEAVTDG